MAAIDEGHRHAPWSFLGLRSDGNRNRNLRAGKVAESRKLPLLRYDEFYIKVLTGRKRSFRYCKPGFSSDKSSVSYESASATTSIVSICDSGVALAIGQPSGARLPRR